MRCRSGLYARNRPPRRGSCHARRVSDLDCRPFVVVTLCQDDGLPEWVEAGLTDGPVTDPTGTYWGLQWFWADQRPGSGGYNEHHFAWANTPITQSVSFWWQCHGSWGVNTGNNWMGNSASNGDYGGNGQVGAEITDRNGVLKGSATATQYSDPHNNWHQASLYADTQYRGPMNGSVSGNHMNAYTGTCNAARQARPATPEGVSAHPREPGRDDPGLRQPQRRRSPIEPAVRGHLPRRRQHPHRQRPDQRQHAADARALHRLCGPRASRQPPACREHPDYER